MLKAKATTARERDARIDAERIEQEAQAALTELASTDWRVIRAAERLLIRSKDLTAEFGAERDALREKTQ